MKTAASRWVALCLLGAVVPACGSKGGNTIISVVADPIIAFVTPGGSKVGGTIDVSGGNFSATQGTSTVTVGGIAAAITSWSDTLILAVVPSGVQFDMNVVVVT